MSYPVKCETVRKDPSIVVSDPGSRNNRSKFRLLNPKRVFIKIIRVDDCAIKEGIRCDYLLVLPSRQEIYIELKGSDVRHAVDQIARSIDLLTCTDKSQRKLCFIATTRCPLSSAQIQNLKKKFKKEYNATLTIKNGLISHEYLP